MALSVQNSRKIANSFLVNTRCLPPCEINLQGHIPSSRHVTRTPCYSGVQPHSPQLPDNISTQRPYMKMDKQQGQTQQSSSQLLGKPGGAERTPSEPPRDNSWQYLVALCTLSVVICYADRSNISTAILPMSNQLGWDKAFQGVVLSSFFFGYAATQMVGGTLADKFGGKMVLTGGVALWSLFTFLTPTAAAAGTSSLLATRVLLGIGEGVAFPSIHSLVARNVPHESQTSAVGVITAASYAGTALAFGISPLIITSLGWQYVFFLFASLALLWLPLWLPVNASNNVEPAGQQGGGAALQVRSEGGEAAPVDKWALLKRKEVWAICAAQYTQSWGMYGLLTWLPTFFNDFYGVPISNMASYTLLPYIVQGGVGLAAGFLADKLISNGTSVRSVRVVLQVAGMLGPAACLMLAVSPLVGARPDVASAVITVGLGLSALTLGGVSASHLDISPKNAGFVFGAGNTAGTLAGFLSVPFTGFLLQQTNSWALVFGVTAAHYVVGSVLWALWCGDKRLPEDGVTVS